MIGKETHLALKKTMNVVESGMDLLVGTEMTLEMTRKKPLHLLEKALMLNPDNSPIRTKGVDGE